MSNSINNCYVKLLSGDVKIIQVFEGYRICQMKQELIEEKFVRVSDPDLIFVFNENEEKMEDRDMINFGEIYNVFINNTPIDLTLRFFKDSNGGSFSLHNNLGLISFCGYDHDLKNLIFCTSLTSSEEYKEFKNIIIDRLFVQGLYKKAYMKIRSDLYNTNFIYDEDKDDFKDEGKYIDYCKMTDEDVFNKFVDIFIRQYCLGIKKIVILNTHSYK
jgi:hypothetical protein